MNMFTRWLLAIATIVPATAHADVQSYEAYAYSSDGQLLYRESHWLYTGDGVGQHLIVYRCPNGEPFGRKNANDAPGAATPDFEMLDARSGYREGVRTRDGHREVYKQANSRSPEQSTQITLRNNTII